MSIFIIIGFVFFIASMVQSAIGFGFGLLAITPALMLFDPILAIQIVIVGNLFMALFMAPFLRKSIPKKLLFMIAIGSVFGFPLGIWAVQMFDVNHIKIIVATLIILTIIQMTFFDKNIISTSKKDSRLSYAIGIISGALMSGLSTPGPVIMVYLTRLKLDKDEIRATILGFYALAYCGATVTQYYMVGFSAQLYDVFLVTVPFILGGIICGHVISGRIKQEKFCHVVLAVLLISSVYTLWSVI